MRVILLVGLVLASACTSNNTSNAAPKVDPTATVRFVTAPQGDVAPLVVKELARAKGEKRQLLLYVSAPWCEPCRVFHEAVDRGELTGKVGALDLLSFDGDMDAERLIIANYEAQFIPAFHVPLADGQSSGKKIEGSVKGGGAVADLVPRLKELLGPAPN
ncbi:MAG: thioredoxin [Archangium sp.]|nr:thioredoxin [Archangium sp.]